ncbi:MULTISPECIES: HpcH/HpaI aldolase/citrate lyase family protein [unclassified Chelatococcus]|jgi:4-hydroxy-2-oxoheptanedioate aldolase|uniref:HpcH/HpaI aldolase family protein n=1 Tax=unclassified Chelatococcus TaxID=2638111 RepID=UPI001BD06C40|nr:MULTISPECIES: HpcH/HpaI aldolase/citrate lyase family protein [unclassified Chelatococcus]CAH1649220.1 4-hydroxy-2-oxo-heptane-1,7-dioate aldolase [Hyphomicrobiales bacterium]MBS7741794.1 HpcH/HpaI aldolase/citrate lyase family protein [Chelatococcus sp. HY11]MBX3541408.1 HpcH/HpaI aldolase/citrate lyase family protein [Chelatococcus sp.]MCO5074698.1 HpcH/HpaI aldolase/citrate lyase family protein [Chelatococcus sp.]CAH1691793.1 4-hydroxy-2-oxo-heptane-1,7-dioate aldolase [Hyphomicrobiales 
MPAPVNPFKAALAAGRRQTGLWLALGNALSAELVARVGYDWLVIDLEHAPNDLRSAVAQMQAIAPYPVEAVIRPPIGEAWMLKQLLDGGARTFLIPMVESVAQARDLVAAVRYPPHGVRGVGAALARASGFGDIGDYLKTANGEICLLMQIESARGVKAIEDIAAIDGVDGLFIGPADLAADLGYLGQPGHEAVREAVCDALRRIKAAGKPAGVLTSDPELLQLYTAARADFVAIGSDVGFLREAASLQLKKYNSA